MCESFSSALAAGIQADCYNHKEAALGGADHKVKAQAGVVVYPFLILPLEHKLKMNSG